LFGGIGGEIAAWVTEHCFEYLDAPIMRCAGMDSPIPFNIELEKQFMANGRLDQVIQKLIMY
jgi:2-oxoisovalerate dehydrogenase E1 component